MAGFHQAWLRTVTSGKRSSSAAELRVQRGGVHRCMGAERDEDGDRRRPAVQGAVHRVEQERQRAAAGGVRDEDADAAAVEVGGGQLLADEGGDLFVGEGSAWAAEAGGVGGRRRGGVGHVRPRLARPYGADRAEPCHPPPFPERVRGAGRGARWGCSRTGA